MILTTVLLLFLLLAIFILFMVLSEFVTFVRTRVPFVPTSKNDIEFLIKQAGITNKDVFYDLGSGNGKVLFMVEKLSGAKVKGFELGWWTILYAKIKLKIKDFRSKKKHPIEFVNKNFFHEDWSEASIIYCYLYPPLMGRIEEKFKTSMKPGSMAIVRDFPFPNMPYKEKHFLPKSHEIYIYQI